MLKISVITVCFNSVKTIEQTIRSVIMQDYCDIEYIIVDGGSTDGTLEIIRKYENYLSNWISEPDRGIYDAMNKGIDMATGEIIAFLNSDDWYKENIIQCIANDIQNSKAPISCYDVDVCEGAEIRRFRNELAAELDNIRICMIYSQPATFAKRSLFDKYGKFDVRYKIAGDYDWLLRMYNNGVDIKYKHITVTNFRQSGISSVQGLKASEEARTVAISALYKLREEEKISEIYFCDIYDKIIKFYDEAELYHMVKKAIKNQWIKDKEILRIKLKKEFKRESYSIFGCGLLGEECFSLLKQLEISVSNFWDNNSEKWGSFCGSVEIKSPYEIEKGKTVIIISAAYHTDEIGEQLRYMGLVKEIDFIDYNTIRKKCGMIIKNLYPQIIRMDNRRKALET